MKKTPFGVLLSALVSPRRGLQRLLNPDEPGDQVALPLFSALLGYFGVALVYAVVLRRAQGGGEGADVPARAVAGLTAAVPFITSITVVINSLLIGLVIWLIARLVLNSPRLYGDWVGLAALSSIPGIVRLLIAAIMVATGRFAFDWQDGWLTPLTPGDGWTVFDWLGAPTNWPPLLAGALAVLDPFQIWSLVILAVGVAVYSRRSLAAGAMVAAAVWLLQAAGVAGRFVS